MFMCLAATQPLNRAEVARPVLLLACTGRVKVVLYSAVAVWALARNATNRALLGEVGAVERLLSLLEMMQEEEKVREVSTPPGIATTTAINYVKSFAFQHLVLHFNASSPTPIPLSFTHRTHSPMINEWE